jgi:hypothetical protein
MIAALLRVWNGKIIISFDYGIGWIGLVPIFVVRNFSIKVEDRR